MVSGSVHAPSPHTMTGERDTHRAMAEECTTTADLVARELLEAVNRRDFDEFTTLIAPDAVLESMGMGTSFEGVAAIRGFFEDWTGAYEEYGVEREEILDLGNGVAFGLIVQQGRPVGSSGRVQMRFATVVLVAEGALARATLFDDVDEARAAAERLAEARG